MEPDELQKFIHRLVDAHADITRHLKRRPRKAAKILCEEFRFISQYAPFWEQLTTTAQELAEHGKGADELVKSVRPLLEAEASIFAQLGIDHSDAGAILANVYGGFRVARALDADLSPDGIKLVQDQFNSATHLICDASRGPIRGAFDFVLSKKGAMVIGGVGLGAANLWHAVTPGGHPQTATASLKVAGSIINGDLSGILELFGKA